MENKATTAYKFDRFVLDLERGALLADGVERGVRPKSFALLRHFVENSGRLIDRSEIMHAVWPGVFVSDDSITQCVGDIRRVLGDGAQQLLRTLPRRGYLLTAQVARTIEQRPHAAPAPISETQEPPASGPSLPSKPSIAVLPFQNMSGDPTQEYFVDGMVEEITTAIARLPWLFVLARNSSFAYKGKAVGVRQVARELGVRYVLEGSVRKDGNRVRITAQLIDTATGGHIWADRFDGALDDIFELQDRVASSVVGAIEPRLRRSEVERAARKPTDSLDAYDFYLRAVAELHKYTGEGTREAIALLQRALAIDPSYAPSAAMIGWCRILQRIQGWTKVSTAERAEAVGLARQAIEAGRDDPDALSMAGYTIAVLAGEHSVALGAIDRALAINPNSALAWSTRGWVLGFQSRFEPAIDALHRAIRLSPLDPLAYLCAAGLAFAHFSAGRYIESIEWADQALQAQPRYLIAMRQKLVCLAHLGRTEEARDLLKRAIELNPRLTVTAWKTSYATMSVFPSEPLSRYVDGLRKAGVPEG